MSDLREDDEVTLVATITVRYSAERGMYGNPSGALLTDWQMATVDQDEHGTDPETVLSWAAGPRDITVDIKPERAR